MRSTPPRRSRAARACAPCCPGRGRSRSCARRRCPWPCRTRARRGRRSARPGSARTGRRPSPPPSGRRRRGSPGAARSDPRTDPRTACRSRTSAARSRTWPGPAATRRAEVLADDRQRRNVDVGGDRPDRDDERQQVDRATAGSTLDAADAEVLELGVVEDAVLRAFAAEARFLDAAERRDLGRDDAGVEADDAVLERLGDAPASAPGRACRNRRRGRTRCRWPCGSLPSRP